MHVQLYPIGGAVTQTGCRLHREGSSKYDEPHGSVLNLLRVLYCNPVTRSPRKSTEQLLCALYCENAASNSHLGGEGEPLLRWLAELDAAVNARQITDEGLKVSFAMSCLAGRAKTWAYGRRLHDPSAFTSYEEFKSDLKLTFEPPKNEFRSRAQFLGLRQGKHGTHVYSQREHYLVSNVVEEPIDMAAQIAVYMKGLNDGPIKTYLFRDHPKTLEEAISRSI
ncbi:reverse transcriptase, partial [Globisporangium splendens]